MTVGEREARFKEVMPAAIVAISDVLAVWQELIRFDSQVLPAVEVESRFERARLDVDLLLRVAATQGLYAEWRVPGLFMHVRSLMEDVLVTPPGRLTRGGGQ